LWPYLLLAALAFGIYANALGNGFVSDDDTQLLNNPLVTDWREIPQIFQHDIWAFAGADTSNYYRPTQTALYMAVYYAFGFNALDFHLAMILLHVANTLLVYYLGKRLLQSLYPALVAGIIFAVHPIHNEPVVWIAALPDVFLAMVVLVSLILFLRWDAAPSRWQIVGLAGLFFLALLTKEPGAMLVPLLAGYEFFYLGRSLWPQPSATAPSGPVRRTLWDNWPLYASLMGVFGVYALLRLHALGAMAPAQGRHHLLHGKVLILSIIVTLGEYLGKLALPIHLNSYHFFEATTSVTPLFLVSLAVEFAVVAAIVLLRKRSSNGPNNAPNYVPNNDSSRRRTPPLISYALLLMLAPLLPVLNINGVGDNVFAERYLYLPSVGFVLLVAVTWEWLAAKQRRIAWAAVAVIVVASAWILLPRNLDWHDDERLLTVCTKLSPKSGKMVSDLGWFRLQRGEYDAAIEKFLMGIRLEPDVAQFHSNLANAYVHKGRYQDALAEFHKAIELKPDYAPAHMGLGLLLEEQGDIPGAMAEHRKAISLKPNYSDAYTALALLYMKENDYPAAIDLLQRAIAVNPRDVDAYTNLGAAYDDRARYPEASAALRKAIEVGPYSPNLYAVYYDLGMTYAHMGSGAAAALEFSKALQLKPGFAPAQDALRKVLGVPEPQPR
jgi:Flp pilus assembly protein TadD